MADDVPTSQQSTLSMGAASPERVEPEGQEVKVSPTESDVKTGNLPVLMSPRSPPQRTEGQEVNVSPEGQDGQPAAADIHGDYAADEREQKLLQMAAARAAKAQEASKRFRLRTKTPERQKDVPKPEAGSGTKEPRPATKSRAKRGTAGTFCGRRPPSDPDAAAEFVAIRDAYFQMRADVKASKKKSKVLKAPSACEYLQQMRTSIADLKKQHPGQPSRWILAEAHKVRASRSSGSTSQAKAKGKKATQSKKGKEDDKEKEEKKAKRAKKGKKEEEEKEVDKCAEPEEEGEEREEHMHDEQSALVGELCAGEEGEEREEHMHDQSALVGELGAGEEGEEREEHMYDQSALVGELRAGDEGDSEDQEGEERIEGEFPDSPEPR